MAGLAARTDLAVRAVLLAVVAVGAGFESGEAGVGFVAVGARLVAARRALAFGLVAAPAGRALSAGVGFVTTDALLVARVDEARFFVMAARAGDFVDFGMVGEAAVAVRTGLVAPIRGRFMDAFAVALRAKRRARELEAEGVRLVAARALGAAVSAVIGLGYFVARRAGADVDRGGDARGVRVVAADARPLLCGMIGVNVFVARGASAERARFHVVRRVAVGAAVVRADPPTADDVYVFVTAAAGDGLLRFERVRLVAARAFGVPLVEERRRRNDGLVGRVAFRAGAERVFGG